MTKKLDKIFSIAYLPICFYSFYDISYHNRVSDYLWSISQRNRKLFIFSDR
nr:MAG TPA: hypothetical protein [Caudoviricetes sp.]